MKKKIVSLVLVFALALALGIGGTVAWLTATSNNVTNTFTVGDINISMDETGATGTTDLTKAYNFIPGQPLIKDPTVTVEENSAACWLFVKITPSHNTYTGLTGDIIQWSIDDSESWQKLTGVDNVWYISVDAATAKSGKTYNVLKDKQVIVNGNLTEEMADAIRSNNKPVLAFNAYAIQSEYLNDGSGNVTTAAAAWALLNTQP